MGDLQAARKASQPYRAQPPQDYAADTIETTHEEALLSFGELGLFTLMWRPNDQERGLVGTCTTCSGNTGSIADRQAKAFQQPTKRECVDCYGTTFEGGYRAQIIRPMLMADRDSEVEDVRQGSLTRDSISFETTSDFYFHRGDYVFRADNTRFQTEEKNEAIIRTGFEFPERRDALTGITVAHLEEPTTVAYLIPPTAQQLAVVLRGHGPGTINAADISALDVLRTNGYL